MAPMTAKIRTQLYSADSICKVNSQSTIEVTGSWILAPSSAMVPLGESHTSKTVNLSTTLDRSKGYVKCQKGVIVRTPFQSNMAATLSRGLHF